MFHYKLDVHVVGVSIDCILKRSFVAEREESVSLTLETAVSHKFLYLLRQSRKKRGPRLILLHKGLFIDLNC